jgi:signal transduction histidine kinase
VPRNNGLIEITASTKLNINHFVHLEVEITDNGPGIDPRDYEKLFKPFSKLEST